jgi:hypothetical protein
VAPERWTPEALAALAERLNGPGTEALAKLPDAQILAAWEGAAAAFLDPRSPERRELENRLAPSTGLSPEGLEAGLEAVLGGVRGEPAARLFAEAAQARRTSNGAARRPGFALIVLASNLPALAVQPLLAALAAKRVALCKSPSTEPFFAPAFCRALARRLPPLADAVSAVTWPGGAEDLEAPLLARAGVVLAYGNAEAVASLERRAPPGRVVAYGPRTSLAVMARGASPEAAAPGLARDVALFDQRGCLSIAAVYVEGQEEVARATARELAKELAELARRWPPGPVEPGAAGAAQQVRAEAELRGLERYDVAPELAAGTVIVEPDPTFRPTPGLRTVRVHPIDDLSAVPEALAPWKDRLQGVAFAEDQDERSGALIDELHRFGVSRIAPPGRLQHPDALWHNGGIHPLLHLL